MTPKKAIIVGSLSGMIAFGVTILVNSYYNQLIGWSLGYGFNSLTGGYMDSSISTGEFFASYIQNPSNLIFWIISLLVLAFAVMKGIESWAKIMMPVLYAFGIILCIRSLTLGAYQSRHHHRGKRHRQWFPDGRRTHQPNVYTSIRATWNHFRRKPPGLQCK